MGYSGGIDSAILAKLILERRRNVTLLTLGRERSSDVKAVSENDENLTMEENMLVGTLDNSEIENAAKQVSSIITASSISHYEDCIAFWLISERALRRGDIKYVISANGPDELFCGYDRFRRIVDSQGYEAAEKEIVAALKIAEDLRYHVKTIASQFGLQTCEPFLSEEFERVALQIPVRYKILSPNDLLRKRIWRCFGRSIGLQDKSVLRPKKAMQYGMGIHAITHNMLKHGALKLEIKNERK